MLKEPSHIAQIIDQFTKQAVPFSSIPPRSHEAALQRMIEMSGLNGEDLVLDVACGPGLVVGPFAEKASFVTGVDVTLPMIKRARQVMIEKGILNTAFEMATAESLPFKDDSFSVVLTRYSLHHFIEPQRVVREMKRVCRPSGVVMVVDMVLPSEKTVAYDNMERLRDPSHVRTLTLDELREIAREVALRDVETDFYKWEMRLEVLLNASFPNAGDADKVREIFRSDLGLDVLGVGAHQAGKDIHFGYPVAILCGKK